MKSLLCVLFVASAAVVAATRPPQAVSELDIRDIDDAIYELLLERRDLEMWEQPEAILRRARSSKPQQSCYNCGSPGHTSMNCPNSNHGSGNFNDKEKARVCFSCGSSGHLSRDCPNNKKRTGK